MSSDLPQSVQLSEGLGIELFTEAAREEARKRQKQKNSEKQASKRQRQDTNDAKAFVDQVYNWWCHWRNTWTNISDQKVSRLSTCDRDTSLVIPFSLISFKRDPNLLILNILDYILPVSMFEGLKYPTNHRSPKNVSGYQKIQPFNTNEIMRAIWAQIEHRGPRNSLRAGQYFRALDIKILLNAKESDDFADGALLIDVS